MKKNVHLNLKSFTLSELIIVIMLISILASLSLTRFTETITETRVRNAQTNLHVIHTAQNFFYSQNRHFWPLGGAGEGQNVTAINTGLGLSITNSEWIYSCTASSANDFSCQAAPNNPAGFFSWKGNEISLIAVDSSPFNKTFNDLKSCSVGGENPEVICCME